jgi:ectoine hydroxylase-related dioxygenase (phytanoyl-CoA dioxygenase family)
VGWHQDGNTEHLSGSQVPTIWLGLTNATVENGCLRVVPRSHRLGILSHRSRQTHHDLATTSIGGPVPRAVAGEDHDPSAGLAEGFAVPFDVVMEAGAMSFHHPFALHGSNPNASAAPRIGLSATFSTPGLHRNSSPVALVRGSLGPEPSFSLVSRPADLPLEEAVAAYRASDRQLLYAPS